ncbi:MAG: GAF domain-containing protein [Anaerolineae bacterium]|nr:GAF domain-containing protein [Anaerolineae bacterium]
MKFSVWASAICLLTLVSMGIYSNVCAQDTHVPEMRFDYVFDLGAPGGQTSLQDNDGFLWFGSEGGGLFRWDGYTLKNYSAGPGSLSNSTIFKIVVDPVNPDIFWVGTGGGLNRFDKATNTFSFYQHDPQNTQSLSDNTIQDIVQDGQDTNVLWLATTKGLNKFDKATGTCMRYAHIPNDPQSISYPDIWRIIEDATHPNILWVGTYGGGLDKFDKTTGVFTHYPHDPNDSNSLSDPDNLVDAIIQDKDTPYILWIGSPSSGMDKFDTHTETFTHYDAELTNGEVGLIYDDGNGTLWLGGYITDNGLTLFDKQSETFTNYTHDPNNVYSLSNDLVVNVFEDRMGAFWITSYSGKVDKIDRYAQNFTLYQSDPENTNSLSNNAVTALWEDAAGIIWLGTQAGLNQFDPQTATFTRYQSDPGNPDSLNADYVLGIYEDSTENLWVSLWSGPLIKWDKASGRVLQRYVAETDGFTRIVEDPNDANILWMGTLVAGLAKFNKATGQFTLYKQDPLHLELGPNTGYLYSIVYDNQEDVIWLGGWYGGGLDRFDVQTETFVHYVSDPNDPQSLGSDVIATIYQDTGGTLWIGTQGGGLNRFDKQNQTFTRYNKTRDMPSDVNAILEDEVGNLWLGTNAGIVYFNLQTETVENRYTQSDGLQGDIFLAASSLKSHNGMLWFGGTNGVNVFDPQTLKHNPYAPPVVLTSLTQGGEPINQEDGKIPARLQAITLEWPHNFFEFEFVALNYTLPEKNQYAYMLEGIDRDWHYVGTRRFGNYTTLPAGKYTLRIKAANNDGVWNEDGTTLRVIVKPPFWQAIWFRIVIGTLSMGGIAGGFWWRIRTIKRSQRQLENLVAERTEALQRYTYALAQLNQIAQQLTSTLNLDLIAEQLAKIGPTIVDVESLSVWLLRGTEGKELVCWTASERSPDAIKSSPVNICIGADQGIAGWVLQTGESTLVTDVANDPRFFAAVSQSIGFPVRSLLAVPLRARDTAIGVLEMVNKLQGNFSADDLALAEALAASIAIAIDNARLVDTLREYTQGLETQNAELDAFAHTVAHDLKNPLSILIGFSTLIDMRFDTMPPENIRESLQRITTISYKMTNIIDELLLLASVRKMEEVQLQPLDIAAIIVSARERLSDLIAKAGAEITMPAEWPEVIGYAPWVEEVWVNYISNAVKYGGRPDAQIAPRVVLGFEKPDNEAGKTKMLRFWVKDNGQGLTETEQGQLFAEFTRLEQTRAKGHGLGLSIVRRIVEKLGGNVGVESKVGEGSTFWFTLPGNGK